MKLAAAVASCLQVSVVLSYCHSPSVWKATAKAGKRTTQLDVRVERYVLPKYEVKVEDGAVFMGPERPPAS